MRELLVTTLDSLAFATASRPACMRSLPVRASSSGAPSCSARGGRHFLGELALLEPTRRRLDSLLALIADFDRELTAVKREIRACAQSNSRVSALTRIPGVGSFIALLVIAEVGDVSRFPSAATSPPGPGSRRACATPVSASASARSPTRARRICAGA